jgi:hypothetical protein
MRGRRLALLLVTVALLLLLGGFFRRELLAYLIAPAAIMVWWLLRMTVLAIDQGIYWALLLLLIGFVVARRLVRWAMSGQDAIDVESQPASNPTLGRVLFWEGLTETEFGRRDATGTPRSELKWLLISMIGAERRSLAKFQVDNLLRQRLIPLPGSIHAFLYEDGAAAPRPNFSADPIGFLKGTARSIRLAPARLIRRWSGREAADFRRSVEEILALMETTLEMQDDAEPTDTPSH